MLTPNARREQANLLGAREVAAVRTRAMPLFAEDARASFRLLDLTVDEKHRRCALGKSAGDDFTNLPLATDTGQ
jgi:hypothetical protein